MYHGGWRRMNRRGFLRLSLAATGAVVASAGRAAGASSGGVALVLGGGGCRGYGHLGVLRVLQRLGIKPDLVVGSSVGSLVGALYAAGVDLSGLERFGGHFSPNILRSWIFPKLGLLSGARIRDFVVERTGERSIESLPVHFAAVATDLRTGEMVILDRGDLGTAVQASSSAPGLLEPVRIGRRLCIDGNLASPVPVEATRRLGARGVIAVDVSFPPEQADLADPLDALYQGFAILTHKLAVEERSRADILIAPALPKHKDKSAATLSALIEAGERAAEAQAARLRSLVAPPR